MRQRLESLHPLCYSVIFAVSILPPDLIRHGRRDRRLLTQESLAGFNLIRRRISLIQLAEEPADFVILFVYFRELGTLDQVLDLFDHERTVEHEQGLLWHRRAETLWRAHVRTGKIKRAEQPGRFLRFAHPL